MKSVLKNVGMGLVIVFVFFFLLGKLLSYSPAVTRWADSVKDYFANRSITAKEEAIKKQIAEDTMGGQTPEETFDLFLTALKAGDAKKAAAYYVYNRQREAQDNLLTEIKDSGNLNESFSYFSDVKKNGTKKCNEVIDGCTFKYNYVEPKDRYTIIEQTNQPVLIKAGATSLMMIDLSKQNGYKVWKIEQPY